MTLGVAILRAENHGAGTLELDRAGGGVDPRRTRLEAEGCFFGVQRCGPASGAQRAGRDAAAAAKTNHNEVRPFPLGLADERQRIVAEGLGLTDGRLAVAQRWLGRAQRQEA